MWGIARYKDLSAGDTASYFVGASRWAESLRTDPVLSPLYLIFYGAAVMILMAFCPSGLLGLAERAGRIFR